MKMQRLSIIVLWFLASPVFGQFTPDKLRAITDPAKWAKAGLSIRKAMKKDSLDPGPPYLLSIYYFTPAHKTYEIDSANYYHHLSARRYREVTKGKHDIPDSIQLKRLRRSIDSAAFERAKRKDTEEAYENFISVYSTAVQVPSAVELRDEIAFVKALKVNTALSFRRFLEQHPRSHRSAEARSRMEKLEFEETTRDHRRVSYEKFFREFPNNPFRPIAERKIFDLTTASGTPKSFIGFLTRYPNSRWANRSRALLFTLQRDGEEIAEGKWKTDSLKKESQLSTSYWVPVIKGGLYGFIDEQGKEVIAPQYEDVPEGYRCGEITDRYLVTSRGLIGRNGKVIWKGAVKEFDDLGLGFIFVATDSGSWVVHESGYRLTDKPAEDAQVIANRFVGINQDDHWMVMSLSGMVLLPHAYDDIGVLDSIIQLTRNNKRILTTPSRIARVAEGAVFREDFVFDETRKWGDQHYWVRNGVLEGVIDGNLEYIIPLDRQALRKTSFGFTTRKGDNLFIQGITKLEGKSFRQVVEQAGWIRLEDAAGRHWLFDRGQGTLVEGDSAWFRGKIAFLQQGDSVRACLPDRTQVVFAKDAHFQFKEYRDSAAFMILEEKKRKAVYDASSGKKLFVADFDQLESAGTSLFFFTRLNKKGLMRGDGKIALPAEYDAIVATGEQSFSLLKEKKFGWYNSNSNQLMKPVYDRNVRPYNAKTWIAFKDKGYGFLHPDGKPMGAFEWEEIQFWNDSVAWVKKGATWKLLEVSTQKIRLDNIRQFNYLRASGPERLVMVQQDKVYGVLSSRRGTVVPVQYTEVINLGTSETPLYFTERHIPEAGISVIVYFNQYGKTVRSQALEAEELDKIACEN